MVIESWDHLIGLFVIENQTANQHPSLPITVQLKNLPQYVTNQNRKYVSKIYRIPINVVVMDFGLIYSLESE
jgi:hypothetical protein